MKPDALWSSRLSEVNLYGCFVADRRLAATPLPPEVPDAMFAITSAPLQASNTVEIAAFARRMMLPNVGDVIDKYRIEEHLGRGGFAAVYRATHLLMHAPVALKLLLPDVVQRHPHLAERMCDEARFTALVNHPNVVRVYDVTHYEHTTYIIMEYIKGASLAHLISHSPLRVEEAVRIGIDICSGLRAALECGLFHCDIKPANILIAEDGHAKLVDFGQARREITGADTSSSSTDIVGTPAYMAPEQIEDPTGFDHRADIYALGATLYHALTGQTPFPHAQPLQIIYNHIHTPAPDPCVLAPNCPADLSDLIKRMMAKSPADRPGNYTEINQELTVILGEIDVESPDPDPADRTGRVMGRLRRLFVGGSSQT